LLLRDKRVLFVVIYNIIIIIIVLLICPYEIIITIKSDRSVQKSVKSSRRLVGRFSSRLAPHFFSRFDPPPLISRTAIHVINTRSSYGLSNARRQPYDRTPPTTVAVLLHSSLTRILTPRESELDQILVRLLYLARVSPSVSSTGRARVQTRTHISSGPGRSSVAGTRRRRGELRSIGHARGGRGAAVAALPPTYTPPPPFLGASSVRTVSILPSDAPRPESSCTRRAQPSTELSFMHARSPLNEPGAHTHRHHRRVVII